MKKSERHPETEDMINVLLAALQNNNYDTKRYSDSKKFETSEYDCIVVKSSDGQYYEIGIKQLHSVRHPYTGQILRPEKH